MLTIDTITRIVGQMTPAQRKNAQAILTGLDLYGSKFGLDQPHRQAQFLAQALHESGGFKWDREIWGPTTAQKGYEGRKDLGNTQKGDGSKFRGYGPFQLTGRANVTAFRDWCRANIGGTVPDFVADPSLICTDPWEGLSAIWYWTTRKLNTYADRGDIEMVTRRINGGLNGYDDRLRWFDRTALVLLGYGRDDVRGFQKAKGLMVDGVSGPRTRAALHLALTKQTPKPKLAADVAAASVVVPIAEPVVPAAVDATVKKEAVKGGWSLAGLGSVGSLVTAAMSGDWRAVLAVAGTVVAVGVLGLIFRQRIIAAIGEIRGAVQG